MKISKVKVTPAMARKWLENNGSNRRLRETFVVYIMDEIKQGKWMLTHQGIALSTNGKILDGQHRLTAIARLGVTLEMWVATDCEWETALGFPVDHGEKRTIADVMGVPKDFIAIVNQILAIEMTSSGRRSKRYTTAEREAVCTVLGDNIETFLSHCTRHRKGTTSAKFKVPLFIHWMLHGDEVISQYMAFIDLRQQDMWPRVESFHKQIIRDERIMRGDDYNQMSRVWTAFDPTKRDIERININGTAAYVSEMRTALGILGLTAEMSHVEAPTPIARPSRKMVAAAK